MSAVPSPVIETKALRKAYGSKVAVAGLDLSVAKGEIFGLLGPNGAGKTTTTRMLITLLHPDAGSASILGQDVVSHADEVRSRIGYVPQEPATDRYLTGRENLRLFAALYRVPRREREAKVDALLSLLGLTEAADQLVKKYSGGMRKKLDIATGLLHAPEVLFLDEPSLGLDPAVRRVVWNHILGLKKSQVTVFLCTNSMEEAEKLCDRIAILDRGGIVAQGTPDELTAGLGGDVVTLEPARPENGTLDRLETALTSLEVVTGANRIGKRLLLSVKGLETAVPRVLEAAAKAGIEIGFLSSTRPGLEEVFLKHTGARFEERNL
jgi:ABC-2 type transport system ATP-binding protein